MILVQSLDTRLARLPENKTTIHDLLEEELLGQIAGARDSSSEGAGSFRARSSALSSSDHDVRVSIHWKCPPGWQAEKQSSRLGSRLKGGREPLLKEIFGEKGKPQLFERSFNETDQAGL